MQITNKFRLYPNKKQEERLLWTLEKCRETYNFLLSELQNQKVIDRRQIQGIIPDLRICEPELKQLYSKVLQYECYKLFSNLRALTQSKRKNRKVGRLRCKGKSWFKTFTYNQLGFKIIKTNKRLDRLHLSKIGDIPIRIHRNIKGKIKQVTIKRHNSGRWYASIITETNKKILKPKNRDKIGIDTGLINYVFDSDGNHFDNPKHLDKSLKKLKREHRKLSKKKKNSSNRLKQRIKVARAYEKVVNQRIDFLHKLSRHYINNCGFVAIEDLKIKNMIRHPSLSRSISDASWSRFIKMLEYKAERAGIQIIKVEPRGTSQRCSRCNKEIKKELRIRQHKCLYCGLEIHRDYNSAKNILKLGLQKVGQELSDFKPVETEPLSVKVSSVKESGSHFLKC